MSRSLVFIGVSFIVVFVPPAVAAPLYAILRGIFTTFVDLIKNLVNMDKFVKKAESLKTRLAELDSESECWGTSSLVFTHKEEYKDVILDVKILICEFGNKALIDALNELKGAPHPNYLSYLLDKLIEATDLRSK